MANLLKSILITSCVLLAACGTTPPSMSKVKEGLKDRPINTVEFVEIMQNKSEFE